ncbi:MAG: 16S rRNA (adenine(1518)-N(6)/adenine(1519)-N(6))-dimethyltransferase RsmA [Candidatus Altiarchaeota archaeon]
MFKPHGDKHFMVDEALLDRLAGYANLADDDVVLEVGPGTGNLTGHLVGRCSQVIAVEKDRTLSRSLAKKFGNRIKLLEGDVLKMRLPEFDKCVSNLPYSISRKFMVKLLTLDFEAAVLVVQSEFADKLNAKPGNDNYRMISALAQSTAEIEILERIPQEAFDPKPNVTSTAVRIRPKRRAGQEYINFLNNLFNHKNKKLRNIMDGLSESVGEKRPVELEPEELVSIYESL